jgi:glycosyltransferase involved in cell wall biosynthesis/DNA-binding beta-propeller fold protein YncE
MLHGLHGCPNAMSLRIEVIASEGVHKVLAELGRTEDVKFSPSHRRIAVAGFSKNKIVVLDVDIGTSRSRKQVFLTDFLEITSPGLHAPHGVFFMDEETLVVANREGGISILKLPARDAESRSLVIPSLEAAGVDQWVYSPGSVSVSRIDQDRYAILVCNNYAHYVSRHILSTAGGHLRVESNKVLLSRGLDIPDGVAVNRDGRWIAISNHNTHSVLLFANTPQLNQQSEPDGILRNVNCPHGLRFTTDDEFLLVADAGSPHVHVYAKDGDSWRGVRDPVTSFQVMDTGTFLRGRYNPQEGGPKGIDIDTGMDVLVTTSEHQALAFFDLPGILQRRKSPAGIRSPADDDKVFMPLKAHGHSESGRNPAIGRMQWCPCGSAKRYKHCCGRLSPVQLSKTAAELKGIKAQALTMQQSGRLESAEKLYRQALDLAPEEPDCLHMLGVVLYSLARHREAAPLVRKAGETSHWSLPGILRNFGLIVGERLTGRGASQLTRLRLEYDAWLEEHNGKPARNIRPLVSVVIPSYNHAAYIEQALDSVFAQTYPNLELIIIDDGSTDGSPEIIQKKLQNCPFPHRFMCRENRGAHATLNEAIHLARGAFVNPLNSDDLFEPTRIADMVEAVAGHGFEWGFTGCDYIDGSGRYLTAQANRQVRTWTGIEAMVHAADTVGAALLSEFNPTVSTGNLFFARDLFERVSGFRALRSNHDWDFCLRMLWFAEPRFVAAKLYRYRLHATNTISESIERNRKEAWSLLHDYHSLALARSPVNPFAPARSSMGLGYIAKCLSMGQGDALTPAMLLRLDDEASALDRHAPRRAQGVQGSGLNIVGYFRGDIGLAESVRTLARTCQGAQIEAVYQDAAVNLGSRQSNRTMDRYLTEAMPHRNVLFYMNPDQYTPVWRRFAERGQLNDRYVIGYWYWEIDAFPNKWRAALDRVDEIWVATDFVRNVIQSATKKPVHKIPHAIDVALSRLYCRAEFSLPERPFLFLFSFDFGSFAERKNPWAAIAAFQRAFPRRHSHVGIVIKCSQGYMYPEKFNSLRALSLDDPRIIIVDRLLSREDVYGLQSVCDAYVSLHRSEGLGLGMAECMALGKPVIATAYSGNLEFMTSDNSCLVGSTLIPVKPGEFIDYEPGWHWADADAEQAAGYMRRIVEDQAFRRQIGDRARFDMALNFSHDVAARAIRSRLSALSEAAPRV